MTNGVAVWTLVATFVASVIIVAPLVAAQSCDRSGGPTAGDWNITDTQVCTGILVVMDGNLNISGAGSLTMIGGSIKFQQDTSHVYGVSVTGGGDLILTNSRIWTEALTINPYLKLAVTISGGGSTLTMTDSTLTFPGWVNVSAGAIATLTRSTITKTTAELSTVFGLQTTIDANDDAPGLTFSSSTVNLFASRIENLYEYDTLTIPDPRQSIRLIGTTILTAVDTFLTIDVNNPIDEHNTLALADSSNAYLYGVSTDPEGNGQDSELWTAPITTTGTARADIYRWANARVVDFNGVPVPTADIDADFRGPEAGPMTFRDNAGNQWPPTDVLNYMGKTGGADPAGNWDVTGVDGLAHMPLLSDWVDASTTPNSRFVGTFNLNAQASGGQTGDGALTFDAFPLLLAAHAQKSATISILALNQSLPDLVPLQPTFVPVTPLECDDVTITAPIANLNDTGGAANVLVRIYDGTTLVSTQTIDFIGAGGQQSIVATIVCIDPGSHVILVSVDPDDDVKEGPGASAETNNDGGFPLDVTALGPDLSVQLTFSPDPGFLNNPVRLDGAVTNGGDGSAGTVDVAFYMQAGEPDATSTPIGIATIQGVPANGTATASLNWTPTSLGNFTFWAWADYQDRIPEPLPYENVVNNKDQNALTIGPAPDLVVFPQDLTMTDPFPRLLAPGTLLNAVVRNAGQASAGPFRVDFFVDGVFIGSSASGGLSAGARTMMSIGPVSFTTCGSHTIGVHVDAGGVQPNGDVNEGPLYELNNQLTQPIQVYPSDAFQWTGGMITADQAVSKSIEITGPVTISNARIDVVQDQDPCGRYYIKVMSGGSLTLSNATLESNWPLVVFVAGGSSLSATASTFNLDVQGKGVLQSTGTALTVWSSTIRGDVVAKGTTADLRGNTFQGSLLHIDTTSPSKLWDGSLAAVDTIRLSSDAPGLALDFDIRNVTFDASQTSQLVFSGDQWVQLTSVTLTKGGDWWTGMATQNARVTRYWWLTVLTVDGTGTRIIHPTTNVTLELFNPTLFTPGWEPAPACVADDCYFNTNNLWPVGVPQGRLLYRASAENRYGNLPPEIRATYRADGSAFVEGQLRLPDQPVDGLVEANRALTLVFSELTPDLSIDTVTFSGGNGINIDFQPLNRLLTIRATVNNTGEIITRGVFVYFYSADVDSNLDGYLDDAHDLYVQTNTFIGYAGPLDVPALSTLAFNATWTPTGTVEGQRIVSAVVDPEIGPDPRAGGNLSEINERNNLNIRTITTFIWADLHLDRNEQWTLNPPIPIANNLIQITFTVRNEGTSAATRAEFGVYNTTNVSIGSIVVLDVGRGSVLPISVLWDVSSVTGLQTIRIRARATGETGLDPVLRRNFDYDYADPVSDNFVERTFTVEAQPELSLTIEPPLPSPSRSQRFNLTVNLTNSGTEAVGVVVRAWDITIPASPVVLGDITVNIAQGYQVRSVADLQGIAVSGDRTIEVMVDADDAFVEVNENDNRRNATIVIQAPSGEVRFETPADRQGFRPGAIISIRARVVETSGLPIPNVQVTARLLDANNVERAREVRLSDAQSGILTIPLTIPGDLPDGTYTLELNATDESITDARISLLVGVPLAWWQGAFLGLPVWIWLLVLIGAIAAIGGGSAYVKFVGLGKLVECGECGAFIPEDSVTCPKCGVEFEKDMAKCSNCQAWIPVDVKQCPECGVEFATGEVEMADYEAKMRAQYVDVQRRFREQASQELGRTLTEREFEDWWRTQPTFVTFEDWVKEEEEMRRMGSKPCPVCNTLNSVTATVCHKCGTLLKEKEPPRGGIPPARPTAPQPQTGAGGAEAAEAGMPGEAIPKKVIKKPIGAPVVQKKVIKRPFEEKEDEGGEGEQDQI